MVFEQIFQFVNENQKRKKEFLVATLVTTKIGLTVTTVRSSVRSQVRVAFKKHTGSSYFVQGQVKSRSRWMLSCPLKRHGRLQCLCASLSLATLPRAWPKSASVSKPPTCIPIGTIPPRISISSPDGNGFNSSAFFNWFGVLIPFRRAVAYAFMGVRKSPRRKLPSLKGTKR